MFFSHIEKENALGNFHFKCYFIELLGFVCFVYIISRVVTLGRLFVFRGDET
jgi:hypothetical protein